MARPGKADLILINVGSYRKPIMCGKYSTDPMLADPKRIQKNLLAKFLWQHTNQRVLAVGFSDTIEIGECAARNQNAGSVTCRDNFIDWWRVLAQADMRTPFLGDSRGI